MFAALSVVLAATIVAVATQQDSTNTSYSITHRNADVRTIIGVGKAMHISSRGWEVAVDAALAESGVQEYANPNVPSSMLYPHDAVGGNGVSVGVFQDQVHSNGSSAGWGTVGQLMNANSGIARQAEDFYVRLRNVNGWETMSIANAAQAVQRSANPSQYGAYVNQAKGLVAWLASSSPVVAAP